MEPHLPIQDVGPDGMMALVLEVLTAALFLFPPLPQDATVAGDVTTPYPTIASASIEWQIQGDDNLNGQVVVQYRRAGESAWHDALPLRRIPSGSSGQRTKPTFSWDNKHAGSIFDLRPASDYEIRLTLSDPDGGSADRLVRMRTRAVPKPAPGARVKQANPVTFAAVEASAAPGDIIRLTPGYYGDFTATRDGEPGRPIVIRGNTNHIVKSTFASVSLRGRRHVIVEKLTVNGTVDLLGAEEVAVRHCRVNARHGIVATSAPGCKNCYIADNTVTYIMPWTAEGMGSGSVWGGPANVGEGIQITGPGNVICHNRITGYRDGISTMEDRSVSEQVSIDIYNNDVDAGVDDCIEADFCMGNCRILRNRLTNCFMALSSQPSVGGPTYFVRNAMYNIVEAPFKLERGSVANVFLHNTVVKVGDGFRVPHGPREYSHTIFRNNLVIGGTGGGTYGKYDNGTGRAIYAPETDPTNDFDYNGVGTHGTPFSGRLGALLFFTFAEIERRLTHTTRVDMNVFDDVEFPDPPIPARDAPHLGLKRGSVAVDTGIRLPNVNDDFAGGAPDLGAYELDRPVPHYGPRPDGVDEGTSWRSGRE